MRLLEQLEIAGFGWLDPDGIRRRLAELAGAAHGEVSGKLGRNGPRTAQGDGATVPSHADEGATISAAPSPGGFMVLDDQESLKQPVAEPEISPWTPSMKDPIRPASRHEREDARRRFAAWLKSVPNVTPDDLKSVKIVQADVDSVLDMEISETLESRRLLEIRREPLPEDKESNPIMMAGQIGSIWNWAWPENSDPNTEPVLIAIPESIRFAACEDCDGSGSERCERCKALLAVTSATEVASDGASVATEGAEKSYNW